MISRAASRTSSERPSATSLRPSISALSFSRVRSDAGILSIGVLLRRGRSPNRTSLISPIRRGCTPTLFPASLGLHPRLSLAQVSRRTRGRLLGPCSSGVGGRAGGGGAIGCFRPLRIAEGEGPERSKERARNAACPAPPHPAAHPESRLLPPSAARGAFEWHSPPSR